MAIHKKKPRFRVIKTPAVVVAITVVISIVIASLAGPALANDLPTGEETSTATKAPAPKDDSSSEAPAAPKLEVVQEQTPAKAETPEPDSKEESQTPPKDEEKVNKPDPKPATVNEGQVCGPLDSGKIDTTGDPQTVTVTAPEGKLIDRYCVKAGSVHNDNGPVYIDVDPPVKTLTFGHPSGKAVSHYSLQFVSEPKCVESIDIKDIVAKYTTDQYHASVEYKGEQLCEGVSKTVSLNSYDAEGPTWETSGDQGFLGHDYFTVDADHTSGTLTVPAAKCFYQTDLYWGSTWYDGVDGALPHYPDSPTPPGLIDHRNGGQACGDEPKATATWTCDSVIVHNDYTATANVTTAKLDQDGKVIPGTSKDDTIAAGADFTRSDLTKGTWDVLVTWDSSEDAVFEEMHEVTGCDTPPTKIEIPQPTFEDPCGPNNASWNEQVDTDTLKWDENDEGHLIATIIKDGVVFTDGTTTHDFGTAPDSGEECPVDVDEPVIAKFCGGVMFVNLSEDNPTLKFTYSDSTQGGANSESKSVPGGEDSGFIAISYKSLHVVVEGDNFFKEYSLTIPQGCDVDVAKKCGEFTFENLSNDVPVTIFYTRTGAEAGTDEHQVDLAPGATSPAIKTTESSIDWFYYFDDYNMDGGTVKVPQHCDTPSHGIGTPTSLDRLLPDTGGSNLGLLALGGALALAGGGIVVASRRRTSNV